MKLTSAPPSQREPIVSEAKPSQSGWGVSEMVLIPAGPFLMGAPKPATVELPEFLIARFPVTNADYAEFVRATGHRRPKHWSAVGYREGLARHPVTYVSWEDAAAYCRWAGLRLPTEAEWEKAARGTEAQAFPWGQEFIPENCNTSESKTDGTRPVDAHPGGVSPYGIWDMAGNVWEWTSTEYEQGGPWRVVKGGSWDFKGHHDSRCATRAYFQPVFRNGAIGFRCARDPV